MSEALSRNSDPKGSHIAADQMEDSGARLCQQDMILQALREWKERNCPTSNEQWPTCRMLEYYITLNAVQINRRVAGMKRDGLIHTRTSYAHRKEQVLILGPDPEPKRDVGNDVPPIDPRLAAHQEFIRVRTKDTRSLIKYIRETERSIGVEQASRKTRLSKWRTEFFTVLATYAVNVLLERCTDIPDGNDLIGRRMEWE